MSEQRVNKLRRRQKSVVYMGLQVFQGVLIMLQLYLFVSALESMLGGHDAQAVPAAAFSILILLANIWIFVGINRLEAQG